MHTPFHPAKGLMRGPGPGRLSGGRLLAPASTFASLFGRSGNTDSPCPSLGTCFPSVPRPHSASGLDHPLEPWASASAQSLASSVKHTPSPS